MLAFARRRRVTEGRTSTVLKNPMLPPLIISLLWSTAFLEGTPFLGGIHGGSVSLYGFVVFFSFLSVFFLKRFFWHPILIFEILIAAVKASVVFIFWLICSIV